MKTLAPVRLTFKASWVHSDWATDLETASKGLFVDSNGTRAASKSSATNGFLTIIFILHYNVALVPTTKP